MSIFELWMLNQLLISSGVVLIFNMDLLCGIKTVWIMISWLLQKPADLDLPFF